MADKVGDKRTHEDDGGPGSAKRQKALLTSPIRVGNAPDPLLADSAKDWAVTHSILMGIKQADGSMVLDHAPLVLFPSPFPRALFERALAVQPYMSQLLVQPALDGAFLHEHLDPAGASDTFTQHLLDIYDAAADSPFKAAASVGVWRSDYMLHAGSAATDMRLLQVENNAISAAFGAMGTYTSRMHHYLAERGHYGDEKGENIPENHALERVVQALAMGAAEYSESDAETVVVFLVQAGETNAFDQRAVEHMLWEEYNVPVVRATHLQMLAHGRVDDAGVLFYENQEVSLIYFRSGYTPRDYPSEDEWTARRMMECSNAIKVPSVGQQLCGAKKIQQVLTQDGMVERFLANVYEGDELASAVAATQECFAGCYALTDATIEAALASPADFVLKPQREGGGNNLYMEELHAKLTSMAEAERGAYILMDRIVPPTVANHFLRRGVPSVVGCVSELGVFGIYVAKSDGTVVLNGVAGHLLRSKDARKDDGGVAAGVALLDSPLLV